jgi:hypothetical protein
MRSRLVILIDSIKNNRKFQSFRGIDGYITSLRLNKQERQNNEQQKVFHVRDVRNKSGMRLIIQK